MWESAERTIFQRGKVQKEKCRKILEMGKCRRESADSFHTKCRFFRLQCGKVQMGKRRNTCTCTFRGESKFYSDISPLAVFFCPERLNDPKSACGHLPPATHVQRPWEPLPSYGMSPNLHFSYQGQGWLAWWYQVRECRGKTWFNLLLFVLTVESKHSFGLLLENETCEET